LSEDVTELFDLRVIVERIEGRSACGLEVGDYFELTESSRLRIPPSTPRNMFSSRRDGLRRTVIPEAVAGDVARLATLSSPPTRVSRHTLLEAVQDEQIESFPTCKTPANQDFMEAAGIEPASAVVPNERLRA